MTSETFGPGVLRGNVFIDQERLLERSLRCATGLSALGVGPGETVALVLRNDHPFFEVSFAAATLGAAPVPVNWHGTADEILYVLRDCRAKVLVGHADLLATLSSPLLDDLTVISVPTPPDIAAVYPSPSEATALHDALEWGSWLSGCEPWTGEPSQEPLSMIYTSGTTGQPKGVRRLPGTTDVDSAEVLVAEAARVVGMVPGMRTVITGPLYHTAPNAYGLAAAGPLRGFVALQPKFDPAELLAMIERHSITHLHLVPIMFVRLLKLDQATRDRYDLSSLAHVVHAAAPCPPEVKRAMIDWWGPIIWEYYGGTETGAVVGCSSDEWLAHPGTVGRPLATAEVRIYDDAGRSVPPGTAGEVYVRLHGWPDFTYEGKPEARAQVERDSLVTCGDIGYLDEDGYLYLCDRKRDLIISGGVNIYPAEIEAALLTMPGVRDCAVFGIPDDEYGEQVAAAVEPETSIDLTVSAVRAHVRSVLAGFKVPKIVTFHETLPREDSGKIFKRLLRAPYWEMAGRTI